MDTYFTESKIIYYLCRVRAKYAKQRSKKHLVHLLSNDANLNHHKESRTDDEIELSRILPPRRMWKKLGKEHRYINRFQKINSINYNAKCIYKTVKFYQKNHPEESFVIQLNKFIEEIRSCINNPNYKINSPSIYPKPKEKISYEKDKENICRPISLFTLKDKIIISQTNKYLSSLFDSEFYQLSHAFRAPVKGKDLVTHHDSIQAIIDYKSECNKNSLWVAECDMSKFYDSVGHSVILNRFSDLIVRVRNHGKTIDERAINIFNEYLNSYCFVKDVLPKNKENEFWEKHKIPNGQFGWVKDELINHGHYSDLEGNRIGIPQGGALSGLIANIVLDYADSEVIKVSNADLLYIRFCDDMILIHPEKISCRRAVKAYEKALLDLKLVPHKFKSENELFESGKIFWKSKSKSPYKWTAKISENASFPWIGFVGYELHFNGNIRVRKKSLKKEINKQKEVVNAIRKAIQKDKRRERKGTILESAINRLNGMSVGRVDMWNHKEISADMCWVNGFKKLEANSTLEKQLKKLDKNKNHQISKLKQELSKLNDPPLEEEPPNRKFSYYGKPYSYYHQVLKKMIVEHDQ